MTKGSYISIDFEVKLLEQYYSFSAPGNAYRVLKTYLTVNGFEHIKDTNYKSTTHNFYEAVRLIDSFAAKYKWFALSVKKVDISLISDSFSIINGIKLLHTDERYKAQKEAEYIKHIQKEVSENSFEKVIKDAESRVVSPENYNWAKRKSMELGISTKEFINSVLDKERDREAD